MGRTPDYAISELEYQALPPVLRRKFFSSLERLRLESDGSAAPCWNASCSRRPSIVGARAASLLTDVLTRSSSQRPGLHKRGLTAVDRQFSNDNAAWFDSLPPAVRRKQFSREEQIIFANGRHCIIVDAPNQAVDRRPPRRSQDDHFYFCFDSTTDTGSEVYDSSEEDPDSSIISGRNHSSIASGRNHSSIASGRNHSSVTSGRNQSSITSGRSIRSISQSGSSCSSRDLDDIDDIETLAWSVSGMDNMDSMAKYSIDSFCFFTDDLDLDLKLDDYHQVIQETAASQKSPLALTWGQQSAARTLSLSSTSLRRGSVSSQTMSPSNRSRNSSTCVKSPSSPSYGSRAVSLMHRPRPSTASVERKAMFYQDPAARMQLRLYLASASKFDEAVEFGFPTIQDASEASLPSPVPTEVTDLPEPDEAKGTFLNDDKLSLFGDDDDGDNDEGGELRHDVEKCNYASSSEGDQPRKSRLFRMQTGSRARVMSQSSAAWRPLDREMTIHMTLTRPDLRSPDETERRGPVVPRLSDVRGVPGLAALQVAPEQRGSRVRRAWNKLRAVKR